MKTLTNVTYSITTNQETLSHEISINSDIVKISLAENKTKMFIDNADRANNKQEVETIERALHQFIGRKITHDLLSDIQDVLEPLLSEIKLPVIAGVKM